MATAESIKVWVPFQARYAGRRGEEHVWRKALIDVEVPRAHPDDVVMDPWRLEGAFLQGVHRTLRFEGREFVPCTLYRQAQGNPSLSLDQFRERFGGPESAFLTMSPFNHASRDPGGLAASLTAKERRGFELDMGSLAPAEAFFQAAARRSLLVVGDEVWCDPGRQGAAVVLMSDGRRLMVPAIEHHDGVALRPRHAPDCNEWSILGNMGTRPHWGLAATWFAPRDHHLAEALEADNPGWPQYPQNLVRSAEWRWEGDLPELRGSPALEFLANVAREVSLDLDPSLFGLASDAFVLSLADFKEAASDAGGDPRDAYAALERFAARCAAEKEMWPGMRDRCLIAERTLKLARARWEIAETPRLAAEAGIRP